METLVSKALMIRLSLQPSPASETSAFNNIRALSTRCAGLFPFRISASSRSRSSPLSHTTYFFTEISFAAMIASVACVATKANHQILSIWLKRPTRSEIKRIERELDTLLNLILKGGAADKINTKMVQLESRRTRTALVNAE